jgi:N utilization substance protein B
MPTDEDLHPNTRFVDNRVITIIRGSGKLLRYLENNKLNWSEYPELIRELYNTIRNTQFFREYLESSDNSFAGDKKIISKIYTEVIYPTESLWQVLEEKSIYWNDDLEFIISMILKTIKGIKDPDQSELPLLPLYKNQEDRAFAVDLIRKSIINREEYIEYIKSNTKNWDLERIAFMDILIMQMAITEMLNFSSIPTKVTLNEYLEISKFYSTSKSSVFINGVLDKVLEQLRKDGKLKKTGRGLIGEN